MKTGKKENPKPLVEKVAEAKPADDAVGKISEKPPVVTDASPPPVPKVEDKPVEKKPDPPKPVAESQAQGRAEADREEAGSAQGRSDRRSVEEGREEAAAEAAGQGRAAAAAEAEGGANLRSVEDRSAARQARSDPAGHDRRDAEFQCGARHLPTARPPTIPRPGARCSRRRSSVAGRSHMAASRARGRRSRIRDQAEARRHAGRRRRSPEGSPSTPYLRVYQESALRAIIECQPYNLPAAFFENGNISRRYLPNEDLIGHIPSASET